MVDESKPTRQVRRDRALEQMDAGRNALLKSLEGLETEAAFLGSRWSVWEVVKHLDSPEFVDSLEKIAAGEMDMLPSFDSREAHLKQELDRQAATSQRLRSLIVDLSEEQLAQPVTPPNPHNNFPALRMIDLIERVVHHEATHAKQIEATRKYVEEFSAKERAVTFASLGPGDPALVRPGVRDLVSYADYVAGARQALDLIRPWIRAVDIEIREDNSQEVLSRLGREAQSGQWGLVVCLDKPAEAYDELLGLAQQLCGKLVVYQDGA